MKTMTPLLRELLETPSESNNCDQMAMFLINHAEKHGYLITDDKMGNLYVTKSAPTADATYPAIVAHMDTVHRIEIGGIRAVEIDGYITGINPLTMEQTGIGGDDKCGIFAALHCLSELPYAKAAFFVDEEVGCLGSYECDIEFFKDCRFVLQADRRGCNDWVDDISGPLGSAAFQEAVKPILKDHGYKACTGMMSDVMALRDERVGISVANMSAGYYNPHRAEEYICLDDLYHVCHLMVTICRTLTDVYPFTPEPRKYHSWTGKVTGWGMDDDSEMFPDYEPITKVPKVGGCQGYCDVCCQTYPIDEIDEVMHDYWVCERCQHEAGWNEEDDLKGQLS